jgi:hypothetical protein
MKTNFVKKYLQNAKLNALIYSYPNIKIQNRRNFPFLWVIWRRTKKNSTFRYTISNMIATDLTRHILSKSTFMKGCQCPKALWLQKKKPDLQDESDSKQEAIFQQGHNVGELACGLFPGGVDATPESYYVFQKSVALTAAH